MHIFQTKVSKEFKSTGCKSYGSNESFLSCEEDEVKKSIKSAIGCLPLPLTWDYDNYCNQNESFSKQSMIQYSKIIHRLDNYLPSKNCQPSCSKTVYDSYLIKSEASTYRVIQLLFQHDISITESQPQYTFLPILTTIEAHIGVCRTLLWILLGLGGSTIIYHAIKLRDDMQFVLNTDWI